MIPPHCSSLFSCEGPRLMCFVRFAPHLPPPCPTPELIISIFVCHPTAGCMYRKEPTRLRLQHTRRRISASLLQAQLFEYIYIVYMMSLHHVLAPDLYPPILRLHASHMRFCYSCPAACRLGNASIRWGRHHLLRVVPTGTRGSRAPICCRSFTMIMAAILLMTNINQHRGRRNRRPNGLWTKGGSTGMVAVRRKQALHHHPRQRHPKR